MSNTGHCRRAYPSHESTPKTITKRITTSTAVGTHQPAPKAIKRGEKHLTVSFIGDVDITFNESAEVQRGQHPILPETLYRTAYEGSATLSQFVTPDCLAKHRDVPQLKLQETNAFQNLAEFIPSHDMTRPRIERQLKTQKKVDPSSYVSLFDSLSDATDYAAIRYNESRLVGHRVYIAEIDTKGLIPATVRGEQQKNESIYVKDSLLNVKTTVEQNHVTIPVWIRKSVMPASGSSITMQRFMDSGEDMYMSIAELRVSDLLVRGSARRDNEWLSCGPIPMSAIGRVMPFDGRVLHPEKNNQIIQSRQSIETYIWDWTMRMWRHNPDISDISHFRNSGGNPMHSHEDDSSSSQNGSTTPVSESEIPV